MDAGDQKLIAKIEAIAPNGFSGLTAGRQKPKAQQGRFILAGNEKLIRRHWQTGYIPVFEPAMIDAFDHRLITYVKGIPRLCPSTWKEDPDFDPDAQHYVDEREWLKRTAKVPPVLIEAVQCQSEGMSRALILTWSAGYSLSSGDDEAADRLLGPLDGSVLSDTAQSMVMARMTNEVAATNLQAKWPLTETDLFYPISGDTFLARCEFILNRRAPRSLVVGHIKPETERRCMAFTVIPRAAVSEDLLQLRLPGCNARQICCVVANLNCLILEYIVRSAGISEAKAAFNQLPLLPLSRYSEDDVDVVTCHVERLMYTSASQGAFGKRLGLDKPFQWEDWFDRRFRQTQLDAYFAHLYGLTRDELRFILDPAEVFGDDSPRGICRVLKEREIAEYGEYRTRRLILEEYDDIAKSDRFRDEMPKRVSSIEIS